MKKNLITDIRSVLSIHELYAVSIFGSSKHINKSAAASVGLALFLNKEGIPTNVIFDKPENIPFSHELIQKKPLHQNFLSIFIDVKKVEDAESQEYKESFVLLNILAPCASKGYGIVNYVANDLSGGAEVIFKEIKEYCSHTNKEIDSEVATYLYMSLLAGTKQFSSSIKPKTFNTAKELLNCGANTEIANYLISKKGLDALKCQELILKNMVQDKQVAYAIISIPDSIKYSEHSYIQALDTFKNIGNIAIWALFLDRGDTYKVLLESESSYRYDVSRIARKSSGEGDVLEATAEVQKFDLNKVLSDINIFIKAKNKN